MTNTVKAALILAAALVVASVLRGGIYQVVIAGAGEQEGVTTLNFEAYRFNRFTGKAWLIYGKNIFPTREANVPSPQ